MTVWLRLLLCSSGLVESTTVSPTACPAGYYCPAGSGTAQLCPPGHYCPPKSSQPSTCPAGFTCPGKEISLSSVLPAFPKIVEMVSYEGWTFLMVPVSATMDSDIFDACSKSELGLVTPCAGNSPCKFNDDMCAVTSEEGCTHPMQTTAKQIGCADARNCAALQQVFTYMGNSACGVTSSYCTVGSKLIGGFAFCAQRSSVMAGATMKVPCPAGHFCPERAERPKLCPAGSFCPPGSSSATPCPAGYFCTAGSNSLTPAPTGASRTVLCPAGHYCPEGKNEAISCPAGKVCSKEIAAPRSCPAGYVCPAGSSDEMPDAVQDESEKQSMWPKWVVEWMAENCGAKQLQAQISKANARIRELEFPSSTRTMNHEEELRLLRESNEQQKRKVSEFAAQIDQASAELLPKTHKINKCTADLDKKAAVLNSTKQLQAQLSQANARIRVLELSSSTRPSNYEEELRLLRESNEQQKRKVSELVAQVDQASAELLRKTYEISKYTADLATKAELLSSMNISDLAQVNKLHQQCCSLSASGHTRCSSSTEESRSWWPMLLLSLVLGLLLNTVRTQLGWGQASSKRLDSRQAQNEKDGISCGHFVDKGVQLRDLPDVVMQEQSEDKDKKYINVICPGAQRACVEALPNGVRVSLENVLCPGSMNALQYRGLEKEFTYDHEVDGWFEPCHDECSLDCGVLKIVLTRKPPQRMTLISDASGHLQYSAVPVSAKARAFPGEETPAHSNTGQKRLPPEVHCMAGVSSEGTWSVTSSQWNMLEAGARSHAGPSPPPSIAADALSTCSQGSVKCYLPNTAFKSPDGHLALVQTLQEGSRVLLNDGREACVTSKKLYCPQRRPYNVIELVTTQGSFKVSAKHLVAVPDGHGGHLKGKCADELQVGDLVVVGAKERALTKVIPTKARTELYMVSFYPDAPVEAFPVSSWGIQTYGQPQSSQDEPVANQACGKDLLQSVGLADVSELDLQMAMPIDYED